MDSSAGCRNRKPSQTHLGGISRAEVASHQNSVWVLRRRRIPPFSHRSSSSAGKARKTQGPHEFFPSMLPACGCPRILDHHEADDGLRSPCNDNILSPASLLDQPRKMRLRLVNADCFHQSARAGQQASTNVGFPVNSQFSSAAGQGVGATSRKPRLLRNSCRPLKGTRFVPLSLSRHCRAGLSDAAPMRLG